MEDIRSEDITPQLDSVLHTTPLLFAFAKEFSLRLGDVGRAEFIAGKQYGGRVIVPFNYRDESGEMIILGMNAGDGTGDASTFNEGDLIVPEKYLFSTNQKRVFPRAKTIVTPDGKKPLPVEVAAPLATLTPGGAVIQAFNTDLIELGVRDSTIVKIGSISRQDSNPIPKMLFTVEGTGENRFGDPHTIFAPKNTEGRIQIVAFIAAQDIRSQIGKLLDQQGSRMPDESIFW